MAMTGYTKLFNSILASTIWRADNVTRIVWITLLAMADKNGIAEGSVPGLADFARVSIKDARKAIANLSAPDEDSRTKEHNGRRIEAVDGGWRIINHAKYRAKMSADERREYNRVKQAEHRQRASASVNNVIDESALSAHTEADTEAEAVSTRTRAPAAPEIPLKKTTKTGTPEGNYRLIVALVRKELLNVPDEDLPEAAKTACARRGIAYNSQVIRKAVDAVTRDR